MTTHWPTEVARAAAAQRSFLPAIGKVPPIVPGHDVWDMWQVIRPDGTTAVLDGRSWWFFLATPRFDDPEDRHDAARMRLISHGVDGWRDHGWVFDEGATPGSREWSGSAVLDGDRLVLFFTAAGRRGGPRTFEQRLFETGCRFGVEAGEPQFGRWTDPVEFLAADPRWYARADQAEGTPHGIKGFRDPAWFVDPADGREYLAFTGSSGRGGETYDGVIGLAERVDGAWQARAPLVEALGVNSEMERPGLIARDGLYYLFFSTQRRRFAPDVDAPNGLYGFVADRLDGAWRPLNGSGLVAANPPEAPLQAYCWWVTAEGDVTSFVDYPGVPGPLPPATAAERRATFGGTAAPWFRLDFAGETVTVAAQITPSR